jgi:heterodisulfide reductase subunit B
MLAVERLAQVGLSLGSLPEVHHLLQVLDENHDLLASRIERRLSARVAVTYPCQVFRPESAAGFDDPEEPQVMRRLVALTGAEVIGYEAEYDCCGSTLLMSDRTLALEVGKHKLLSASEADVMVDACGNCHLLLDRHGAAIALGNGARRMPIMFISQILGLAVGLEPTILGVRKELAAQLFGEVARTS